MNVSGNDKRNEKPNDNDTNTKRETVGGGTSGRDLSAR